MEQQYGYGYDLLEYIATATNSELILFFIIVAVVLTLLSVPFYAIMLKNRKQTAQHESERHMRYMDREKHIIDVVTANTEIMAELKATLERDGKTSNATLERIHARIDQQATTLTEQNVLLAKMQSSLDEVVRKQLTICDDIKRGFAETRKNNNERSPTA